ncbi:hypothetical protein KPL71_024278 [Citrus sinensis]|uniref:Uncharacterized protein n=1 Tax=Citrus sinensis TaxID=2711 RepID=A0ACB8IQQ1_CITSI|nr:hypothetical protein KPL71_024278 [Citrus sinensis]
MWMLWLMLLLLSSLAAASSSNVKPGSGCQEKCGHVTVPYPFGIDNSMCAMNKNFFLNCSRGDSPPKLMIGDLEVFNLSIENGSMIASISTAHRCYDGLGNRNSDYNDPYVKLGNRPLRFSDTRNKLTAIGCDTSAYMGDPNGSFWTGCISMCTNESAKLNESSCSGIGCCQTPLPKSLKSLNLTLRSVYDHEDMGKFMPCDYAILADETFNIAEFQASEDKSSSNVTIEWVVREKKCPDDPNSKVYGCGDYTTCYYSENGQGYRCKCKPGFQGNPYLGCVDIDECLDKEKYHCEGKCKNTIGSYTCDCPIGMYGDDVTVPYPFGIDDHMCAMNKNFFLNCSRRDSPLKLMIGELEVFNLSIEIGSMIASIFTSRRCYDGLGKRSSHFNNPSVSLGSRPLRFSDTRNKLTAIGCDTLAYMGDPDGSFWSGCISICTNESAKLNESSCSGIGCCQTPLPKSLKSLELTLRSVHNHEDMGEFMPCDYALLADETFNIAEFRASDDKSSSNVTI